MKNLKNGILCNCGANLLETGVTDFGKIYLSYSGDNKFNKGEFEFGTFPSTCPECSNDITSEIQNLLSDIYPDLSDVNYSPPIASLLRWELRGNSVLPIGRIF